MSKLPNFGLFYDNVFQRADRYIPLRSIPPDKKDWVRVRHTVRVSVVVFVDKEKLYNFRLNFGMYVTGWNLPRWNLPRTHDWLSKKEFEFVREEKLLRKKLERNLRI